MSLVNPQNAVEWREKGVQLALEDRMEEAHQALLMALSAFPYDPVTHSLLGACVGQLGDIDGLIQSTERALTIAPDMPAARYNRAYGRFLKGDWAGGWADLAWGVCCGNRKIRTLTPPDRTEPKPGETILVWAEQGQGDTFWLCRYLKMLKENYPYCRVLFEVPWMLLDIMHCVEGADFTFAQPPDGSLPHRHDRNIGLYDLPLLLDPEPWWGGPYIPGPEEGELARMRETLGPGTHVGVVWRGNPAQENDRNRSIGTEEFAAALPPSEQMTYHSLQQGHDPPEGVVDHRDDLTDWMATSNLIAAMDLIVTVDTAVAHLAGAMGKRVLLMLCFAADFRYGSDPKRTGWYPETRMFRQARRHDWSGPIQGVWEELTIS